jgi:hypothetical protein
MPRKSGNVVKCVRKILETRTGSLILTTMQIHYAHLVLILIGKVVEDFDHG